MSLFLEITQFNPYDAYESERFTEKFKHMNIIALGFRNKLHIVEVQNCGQNF